MDALQLLGHSVSNHGECSKRLGNMLNERFFPSKYLDCFLLFALAVLTPLLLPRCPCLLPMLVTPPLPAQNLALMYTHVNSLDKRNPKVPRLNPSSTLAVMAASAKPLFKAAGHQDLPTLLKNAITAADHQSWTQVAPISLLLTPVGSKTAAIAKLVDVTYDRQVSPTGWACAYHVEPLCVQRTHGGWG
jgi:hypothetical protein